MSVEERVRLNNRVLEVLLMSSVLLLFGIYWALSDASTAGG